MQSQLEESFRSWLYVAVVAVAIPCWGHSAGAAAREASKRPGVPKQAVEVNVLAESAENGFGGDGPTPFPVPKPPTPRPTPISASEAVYAYAKGVTWFTRRSDGRLVWHDCGDVERIVAQLTDAPVDRVVAVEEIAATRSAEMVARLSAWREAFRSTVLRDDAIEDVNSRWWAYVGEHDVEIAEAVAAQTATETAGGCTTGRCDCCVETSCCPSGHTCSCETYSNGDCAGARLTCSTDVEPEPRRGTRTATPRWNY